jgi:hypothetical protein
MFCTSCGKEFVSDDDSFCRSCGNPKFSSPEIQNNLTPSAVKAAAQLKQATNSLLRQVGKVNLSKATISKRFPKTESITQKKFLHELDSTQLANYLDRKFVVEGYATRTTGTPDDLYIEIGKSGSAKMVSGLLQPITIHVEVDSESTTITLGRAKWGEKAAMQKFGSIMFLPLTFSRTYGLTQDKMPEKIWSQINQFIDSKELGAVEEIVMEGHGQAVDPRFFGGRTSELGVFETRLESTIQGGAALGGDRRVWDRQILDSPEIRASRQRAKLSHNSPGTRFYALQREGIIEFSLGGFTVRVLRKALKKDRDLG